MSIHLIFDSVLNNETFNLWLNHYSNLNVNFKIIVSNNNYSIFQKNYNNYIQYISYELPTENSICLTEYDLLLTYSKNDDDTIIFSKELNIINIDQNLLIEKVYFVPIENKKLNTISELSDFILYKYSNYTENNIKIGLGNVISNNIVCLSLEESLDCSNKKDFIKFKFNKIENQFINDFDPTIYKELNPDLQNLNDIDAKIHYNLHGIIEKREYKYIFTEELNQYLDRYLDIDVFKKLYEINTNNMMNITHIYNKYFYNKIHYFPIKIDNYKNNNRLYLNKLYTNIKYVYESWKNWLNYDIDINHQYNIYNYIIEENTLHDIQISCNYPIKHYNIIEICKIKNNFNYIDILKVFDVNDNMIKYVIYPFLNYFETKLTFIKHELQFNINKKWDVSIINLEYRTDRYSNIMENIKNISWLNPNKFNAIYNKKGYIGCLMSHIEILKRYVDKNVNVLIMEDDNIIINQGKLYNILEILDLDLFSWDIYLGTIGIPTIYLKGVYYVNDIEFLNVCNVTKTNFIYYNKNIISEIIKLETYHIDFHSNLKVIDRYLNLFNVFTSYNITTVDCNDYSDIELTNTSDEIIFINSAYEQLTIQEHEMITSSLPNDFDVKIYKELNYDLQNLDDIYCKKHYIEHGINEKRNYKYNNLPNDFDPTIYKELNPDLQNYTNIDAKIHYNLYGYKEKRKYNDIYFDRNYFAKKYNYDIDNKQLYKLYINDIRQRKNNYYDDYILNLKKNNNYKYIFLVNHDYVLYGANHYLYNLYNVLKKSYTNDIKIILFEIKYNIDLEKKYNIYKDDIIEYNNDPTLLYMIYEYYNPLLIYLNSCNFSIYHIYKYIDANKLLLHSHEIYKDYLLSKVLVPHFVVTNKIADQYLQHYKTKPLIQPPIFVDIDNILILSNEIIEPIKNNFNYFDYSKISIGMCGQLCDRKNYKLFIEISKKYPNYNFIWIGDNKDYFSEYTNIYHIKFVNNPYKYYKQIIDYFILFSLIDPCPYVILENILLETNIITFKNNIYYDHKNELTNNFYYEYPNEINYDNCIDAIDKFVINKKSNIANNSGKNYIIKYFNNPTNVLQIIENKLLSTNS